MKEMTKQQAFEWFKKNLPEGVDIKEAEDDFIISANAVEWCPTHASFRMFLVHSRVKFSDVCDGDSIAGCMELILSDLHHLAYVIIKSGFLPLLSTPVNFPILEPAQMEFKSAVKECNISDWLKKYILSEVKNEEQEKGFRACIVPLVLSLGHSIKQPDNFRFDCITSGDKAHFCKV